MSAQKKLSAVAEAYKRAEIARDWLHKNARCMEVTEDKAGIVWERWLMMSPPDAPSTCHVSVLLQATPHGYDVYVPVSPSSMAADTIAALESLKASL